MRKQQRGAFKAGALVERHHLRTVFLLHDVAVLGHHRRALVAVRRSCAEDTSLKVLPFTLPINSTALPSCEV